MNEPVRHLFGWCQSAPGTKPDNYHNLCKITYRTQFGVEHQCSCPNHETPLANEADTCDNETSPQGASTPAGSDHQSLPSNERG